MRLKCLLECRDEILVFYQNLRFIWLLFSIMFSLLVILFIIKLYDRMNTFKYINKKHGQNVMKIVRTYESLKIKLMEVEAVIQFIKSCKKDKLIPTFAKLKLAIKSSTWKLHLRIAQIIMETEMQNKYREKKNSKKEIASTSTQLKSILGLFLYSALIGEINHVIKSRYKAIKFRQQVLLKSIVHNFSSYSLTQGEQEALSYASDHHIQTNINRNNIKTEFESFFQNLLYHLSDMPEHARDQEFFRLQ